MNARRLWRQRAGSYNSEGPRVIGKERVSVWRSVVEILIVHVTVEDRDGALFAKLESGVRRDVITLRAIVRSDCRAVVLAGVGASDVEPISNDVNSLAEVDCNRGVVRRVETIVDGFSTGDPWTKLNDRRSAACIRRAGLEIVDVVICI